MTVPTSFSATAPHTSGSLEVHLLGCVDFEAGLLLQERLVYENSGRNDTQGDLLICEHPPLITIGREGSRSHLRIEPRELAARQMDVRWLNRGGGCLVHCPGQLAVYPIVPLQRLRMGLSEYRRCLEESVLDLCRELRVPAWRDDAHPGVFGRSGQFAFVGAAVKSWVSCHGLFVNVAPALEFQRMVDPGGDEPRVSSLAALRLKPTTMHQVRESLVRHLTARLGYTRSHLYTGHPLLRRTKKKVYVPA